MFTDALMWSASVEALDLCLFFDADFGSAIGDQLVCQARVAGDVGEKSTQSPGRRAPLVGLALCFASVPVIHVLPPFCGAACSVLIAVAHGLYDTCCL